MAFAKGINRILSLGIPDGESSRETLARKIFNLDAFAAMTTPVTLAIFFLLKPNSDAIIQIISGAATMIFYSVFLFLVWRGKYKIAVFISLGLLYTVLMVSSIFMDSPINPLFLVPVGLNALIYLPEKTQISRILFFIFLVSGLGMFLFQIQQIESQKILEEGVISTAKITVSVFVFVLIYKVGSLLLLFQLSISQNQRNKTQLEAVLNSNYRYSIISLDADYTLMTSNDNIAQLLKNEFGVELKSGSNLKESLKSLADPLFPWIDRAIQGEAHTKIWTFKQQSGTEAHFELNFYPLLTPEGQTQGCSVFIADITNEKIQEDHAWLREQIVLGMVKNFPAIYYCYDENLIFTESVGSGLGVLGLTDNQIVGSSIRDAYTDYPDVIETHERALKGEFVSYVAPIQGVEKMIFFEVTTFFDERTNSGIGLAFDITDKIETREELAKQNQKLTQANHELDNFVYKFTHDLRSPLTSLLGLIELAADDEEVVGAEEYLGLMRKSMMKMDGYVRQIMEFSQNARMEVKREEVDGNKILAECIKKYEKEAAGRKVKLSAKGCESTFKSDPDRLKIILDNLVANAIKYSDPQKPDKQVNIELARSNGHLSITCHDNGRGIPVEHQDKIFEMFQQFHDDATGSGLGLYIVKETVAKLQGDIDLESKENEFTEFRIKVPVI